MSRRHCYLPFSVAGARDLQLQSQALGRARLDLLLRRSYLRQRPLKDDLQSNTRWGATLGQSLDAHNSIKVYLYSGLYARTGTNFTTIGLAWQHQWGAAL